MENSQPKITGFNLLCPAPNAKTTWVDDFICLNIVSVAEAAAMWKKHAHTIRKAYREGRLTGMSVGKDFIITIPSLVRLYGEPKAKKLNITYPAGVVNPNVN